MLFIYLSLALSACLKNFLPGAMLAIASNCRLPTAWNAPASSFMQGTCTWNTGPNRWQQRCTQSRVHIFQELTKDGRILQPGAGGRHGQCMASPWCTASSASRGFSTVPSSLYGMTLRDLILNGDTSSTHKRRAPRLRALYACLRREHVIC